MESPVPNDNNGALVETSGRRGDPEFKKAVALPDEVDEVTQFFGAFGWSLQGRYEVPTGPDLVPSGLRVGDTVVFSPRAKQSPASGSVVLTFSRDPDVANVPEFQRMESEFNDLPFPASPSLVGPVITLVVSIASSLVGVNMFQLTTRSGFGVFVGSLLFAGVGAHWLRMRRAARTQAASVCALSHHRCVQLHAAARQLSQQARRQDGSPGLG